MPKPAGSPHKVSATNEKSYSEHYIQTLCVLPGEAQGMKWFVQRFAIKLPTKYGLNQRKACILF